MEESGGTARSIYALYDLSNALLAMFVGKMCVQSSVNFANEYQKKMLSQRCIKGDYVDAVANEAYEAGLSKLWSGLWSWCLREGHEVVDIRSWQGERTVFAAPAVCDNEQYDPLLSVGILQALGNV